jgi:Tol biopolymer transport system component
VGAPGGQGRVGYDFDVTTGEREPIVVDLVAPVADSGGGDLVADADASVVAFDEFSDSLVPGDTNEAFDVFVLNRAAGGGTVRASEPEDGTEPDGASGSPLLAADGGQVFFSSEATNLVPGDANGLVDVFVRDLETGALANLTPARDGQATGFSLEPAAVSADGSRLLLVGGSAVDEGTFLLDRGAGGGLTRVGERGSIDSRLGDLPDLSGDGALALLAGDDGFVLRDLDSGDLTTVVADGFVDGASLSEDGRFTAFASNDDGLVAGDADGDSDLFVFDRLSGET